MYKLPCLAIINDAKARSIGVIMIKLSKTKIKSCS